MTITDFSTSLIKKQSLLETYASLKKSQKALKDLERRDKLRQMTALGRIVAQSKLDGLDPAALYFVLLKSREELEANPDLAEVWRAFGEEAIRLEDSDKALISLTFPTLPSKELCFDLRIQGLRWNASRKEWYGKVVLEELRLLLDGLEHSLVLLDSAHQRVGRNSEPPARGRNGGSPQVKNGDSVC
jgi:hypothetical protein